MLVCRLSGKFQIMFLSIYQYAHTPFYMWNKYSLVYTGPLSAVTDLGVISNASSVTISWSAPFSLDVTGVDPDIWYSVLLYNVTDENNPKLLEKHTTTTSYTFAPAGFSPCHKYLFSVIALNGAGRGETSRNITTGTQHCDLSTVIYPSSTVKRPETTVPTGGGGKALV